MDTLFQLGDADRARIISNLFHSLGFSYISLWLHVSPQNFLQCNYGYYHEDQLREQQASSSSYGSLARRLFNEYIQTIIDLDSNVVPGLALKRRKQCIVLREFDLQQYASTEVQRRFYREGRIKTVVFMGCRSGEIELGFSIVPQMDLEMKLRELFPEDFNSIDLSLPPIQNTLQDVQQQSRPSSSSSRSLDSPEYPSLHFNMIAMREPSLIINQPNTNTNTNANTNTKYTSPIHPQPNTFSQQGFLTPENVDAAITNAILAALTNPISPSTATSLPPSVNLVPTNQFERRVELSAFRSCGGSIIRQGFKAPTPGFRRQNMMRKVLSFYRGLNITRLQQRQATQQFGVGLSRPTSTQLHHVISERKRREKINESFQALRSLLPPGTKKDKATVLRTTKDYMRSLKDQISELNKRNQVLESQISLHGEKIDDKYEPDTISSGRSSSNLNDRYLVQLTPVMESSSSEERRMDLRVSVQGDGRSMIDLVVRLLGFLKGIREVRLVSMEAQEQAQQQQHQQQQQQQRQQEQEQQRQQHQQQQQEQQQRQQEQQQNSVNRVTMRVVIEANEWDQSAFLEAVQRVVAEWTQ